MAQLQIAYLLRPGTQERWRRLCQELAESRLNQLEASCRQAEITPGAGPASATAPRGTHAHDTAYARAATDPAGTGDLEGSV